MANTGKIGLPIKHANDCPCDECRGRRLYNHVQCWMCRKWSHDITYAGAAFSVEKLRHHMAADHGTAYSMADPPQVFTYDGSCDPRGMMVSVTEASGHRREWILMNEGWVKIRG